ncbi:MAG: metallophosphoesterase [Acidobacteriota bacterium]|nr:metallophosphoesterase [Acidobacteriota bacterium]
MRIKKFLLICIPVFILIIAGLWIIFSNEKLALTTPSVQPKIETIEEIKSNLSKYGDKFYVNRLIKQVKSIKFNKQKGFRFVVFGDSRDNLEIFQMIVKSIKESQPLFAVNTGDMTPYGYSFDMDKYLFSTLEKYANYPFFPVMGNHDCRRGSLAYTFAFGDESRVYHFDYGNCRFIILDNCERDNAMPWDKQLMLADRWLSEKKNYIKFVFMHKPPTDVEIWAYHAMPHEMSAPLVKLMSKHKVDHVFCGHIHAYSTATYGGVEYTVTGGGGAPLDSQYGELGSCYHYVIVDVLPDKIDMKVVRFLPAKK